MPIDDKIPAGVFVENLESIVGYLRKYSVWPATFGLACCAIEMMASGGPDFDIARYGSERFSMTPRQGDVMIISGRLSHKMAPVLKTVYDQMTEPKWVIAMGVCASSGGMFNNYAIVQGADHVIPVDIYLPGCPPRPQMLFDALIKLHSVIAERPIGAARREQVRKEAEAAALAAVPTHQMKGLLA